MSSSCGCPNSGSRWTILAAIGCGTFLTALDSSVVNTILPVIGRHFGKEIAVVEWVVTTYLLGISGLLLPFGRLGDMYGHKRVYLHGLLVFVVASSLCSVARSVLSLAGARALQAVGGSMVMANSPAILTRHFPAHRRGQALGIQATMTYLGLCTGPSFGGYLAAHLGWQSVFWINIPVGLLAFALTARSVPADSRDPGQKEGFDLVGAALFLGGLISVMLALNKGHQWGWGSMGIWGLIALALVLLGMWLWLELHIRWPMLDMDIFRSWPFSAAILSAMFNYMCVYTVTFLVPFYLIQVRNMSSKQAGLVMTTQPVVMALVAPLSGTISDRIGTRLVATPGMAVLAVGLLVLSGLGAHTHIGYLMVGLAVIGLGVGLFASPNNSAVLGCGAPQRRGIASGVLATARNIGMVLGIGLAGAILSTSRAAVRDQTNGSLLGIKLGLMAGAGLAIIGMFLSAIRDYPQATSARPRALPNLASKALRRGRCSGLVR